MRGDARGHLAAVAIQAALPEHCVVLDDGLAFSNMWVFQFSSASRGIFFNLDSWSDNLFAIN